MNEHLANAYRKLPQGDWYYRLTLEEARVLKADILRMQAIVKAAWEVRREEKDYNPCPDLVLRAITRERLHKLLDSWKTEAAKAAEEKR